ncbi:hypothetical protein U9M48_031029 [Paspalum notatum var. saurae]|uniref:Uncharacterized protein n=1 Tax=Paspalum notatum var. saurae TaxID=547442 RepID=A0AAQ3X4A9_PASNO
MSVTRESGKRKNVFSDPEAVAVPAAALASIRSSMRRRRSQNEEPPSATAPCALAESSRALALAASPAPPGSKNLATARATASAGTTCFSSSLVLREPLHTRTPILSTSVTSLSSMNWSNTSGHVSIGTPAAAASSSELDPQCVRNAPTAGCASIAVCGAHPLTSIPFSPTRSAQPSGGAHPSSALTTHRNGFPEASSPSASSRSWSPEMEAKVPKQANTTEELGFVSSHLRHGDSAVLAAAGGDGGRERGPMK